jgi:hypothetical protein
MSWFTKMFGSTGKKKFIDKFKSERHLKQISDDTNFYNCVPNECISPGVTYQFQFNAKELKIKDENRSIQTIHYPISTCDEFIDTSDGMTRTIIMSKFKNESQNKLMDVIPTQIKIKLTNKISSLTVSCHVTIYCPIYSISSETSYKQYTFIIDLPDRLG